MSVFGDEIKKVSSSFLYRFLAWSSCSDIVTFFLSDNFPILPKENNGVINYFNEKIAGTGFVMSLRSYAFRFEKLKDDN